MTGSDGSVDALRREGVLRVARPETEWLSTGWDGGRRTADAAYNVSVPEGWDRTDLEAYADERLERAGFDADAPVLFTGVDVADVRGARCGPVTAYATAGISNPAALPMEPSGGPLPPRLEREEAASGTVNVIVVASRALADGALANLVAVAAEAKAATLLAETGFPGTTTDAVVVGHDPGGEDVAFTGSATPVGAATRACVREAVRASLDAHYADSTCDLPDSVADAGYGVSTDARATVVRPRTDDGG